MRLLWILLFYTTYEFGVVLAQLSNLFDINILEPSPRRDLNFTELVAYDGYKSESHSVVTEDGYILGVYRIPRKESCSEDPDKVPIIFMHGLYLSGDDCIIPGPGKAHCYIYADNCYDVWVPNVRGNRYSRRHTTLNPDKDSKFWDFSLDEMGLFDLPAVINYVLGVTNKTQVIYVAHSQGVALMIILCAKKPEYNGKIKVGFGLSPTVWLEHARQILLPIQGALARATTGAHDKMYAELFPHGGIVQSAAVLLCGLNQLQYPACSAILFILFGYNRFQISPDVFPVMTGHLPAGTSLQNFIRWGQIRNQGFVEFDYGAEKNMEVYNQTTPPLFDLTQVTMRWKFIASCNDYVGDVRDIKKLTAELPNATMCILEDRTFGHLDFVYADTLSEYITPRILSFLKNGTFECTEQICSIFN